MVAKNEENMKDGAMEAEKKAEIEEVAEAEEVVGVVEDEVGEEIGDVIISWDAEEYVVRSRTHGWYVGLTAVGLLLAALAVWQGWWTFLAVVILSVVALLLYVQRPPRLIHYAMTNRGISEGNVLHEYGEFKSFGILQEEGHFAIVLTPRKRFAPRMTVYFPEADGERIVDAFGARLPMQEVKLDFLDKLIKFLRI